MKRVVVFDLMQKNYIYNLVCAEGKDFDENFKPELTPKEMLELGVFGGRYMTDCKKEFPGWFEKAKMKEWSKASAGEILGVVDKYSVELPESEASAPVTTSLSLEVKQEVLEGQTNRYGGPMWGEVNFDRWTLTRKSN